MKKYQIYQVNGKSQTGRYIKFMDLDFVKENNLCTMEGDLCLIDSDLYDKVYEGEVEEFETAEDCLNHLYSKFQGLKPEGYTGHSLSVSDVIVLEGSAYYVDSLGFEEIDF